MRWARENALIEKSRSTLCLARDLRFRKYGWYRKPAFDRRASEGFEYRNLCVERKTTDAKSIELEEGTSRVVQDPVNSIIS